MKKLGIILFVILIALLMIVFFSFFVAIALVVCFVAFIAWACGAKYTLTVTQGDVVEKHTYRWFTEVK